MMNHAVMTEIDIEKENKAIAQEYKELLISYQTLSEEDKN
jgi:GTP pyrophosphokinase